MPRPHEVPYATFPDTQEKLLVYNKNRIFNNPALGEGLFYRKYGAENTPVTWEENVPFIATLTVVDIDSRFILRDEENKVEYNMLNKEALKLLTTHTLVNGTVTGQWIVINKGGVYTIALF